MSNASPQMDIIWIPNVPDHFITWWVLLHLLLSAKKYLNFSFDFPFQIP